MAWLNSWATSLVPRGRSEVVKLSTGWKFPHWFSAPGR